MVDLSRPPSLERETRRLLRQYDLLPRKGLGQSFLIAPKIRELILDTARAGPDDLVVEVGPGTGVLTEALADRVGRMVAIERDPVLHRMLVERLGNLPGLVLIHADALAFDYPTVLGAMLRGGRRARLVSNLPYSIATQLILRLIRLRHCFSDLLVMVQREVAQRLVAEPGTKGYSALTVRCRYDADASVVRWVPRTAFYPRPAVDSALVRLDLLSEPTVPAKRPDLLFRIVRAAFGQRRKTLRNALLNSGLFADGPALERGLLDAGIEPNRRGETLDLREFARLADRLDGSEAESGIREEEQDADLSPLA
jgi:16S rRNA (adenine1518-N6/adenine1519-N6)-dimethyltransferase